MRKVMQSELDQRAEAAQAAQARAAAQASLQASAWLLLREFETGSKPPPEVIVERAKARAELERNSSHE